MADLADIDICDIVAQLYDPPAATTFDDLLYPEADAGVCIALKRTSEIDLVVCRGSITVKDWLDDGLSELCRALASHPALGELPLGFSCGMDTAYEHLAPLLRRRVICAGHSLGAARALIFAGMLAAGGKPPEAAVVFGSPRPGCMRLAEILAPVAIRSYRNAGGGRHDYVTDVPTDPPYRHPRRLIDVYAPPVAGDPWRLFAMHHLPLYRAGLASLSPSENASSTLPGALPKKA